MSDDQNNTIDIDETINEIDEDYAKAVRTQEIVNENNEINAEIRNAELKEKQKRLAKMKYLQDNVESEDLSNRKFDRGAMLKDLEDRKNAVIFINEKISEHFVAAPGSLMVIPSMTNNGKSTLTATISEALVNTNKRVLVLSNEEKEEDVRARVSCLRTSVSFGDYKTNRCSEQQIIKVLDDAELLANSAQLVVISPQNDADAFKVTTVEGVIATLENAKGKFDAVIIDYYTNVNVGTNGSMDPWHVNNHFATELNTFKNTAPFPIILTAQCDSVIAKKADGVTMADLEGSHPAYRWKGGRSILTYATDIIELNRLFEKSCSLLFAHKVRFGHGEMSRGHTLWFDKGMQRFMDKWTPEYDAAMDASKVKRNESSEPSEIQQRLDNAFKDE